ncbi:MAG: isopentenyl-diphosphate Delta-isomerase, partial [Flavisolibacter sp.]
RFDLMKEQLVILVDEHDGVRGSMEKMEAHRKGVLHRAFSIFIFDSKGKMLLQQRSPEKYHGANLWTNACCSHPQPGETTEQAAKRRQQQELGFVAPIKEIFSFTYHAIVENGLIEHEFDHVFAGEYEGEIIPDESEVADFAYENMDQIRWALENQPLKFTSWFRIAFPMIELWWKETYGKITA